MWKFEYFPRYLKCLIITNIVTSNSSFNSNESFLRREEANDQNSKHFSRDKPPNNDWVKIKYICCFRDTFDTKILWYENLMMIQLWELSIFIYKYHSILTLKKLPMVPSYLFCFSTLQIQKSQSKQFFFVIILFHL